LINLGWPTIPSLRIPPLFGAVLKERKKGEAIKKTAEQKTKKEKKKKNPFSFLFIKKIIFLIFRRILFGGARFFIDLRGILLKF
jgi:hypothetical protein